jgi:hypothetical protein
LAALARGGARSFLIYESQKIRTAMSRTRDWLRPGNERDQNGSHQH